MVYEQQLKGHLVSRYSGKHYLQFTETKMIGLEQYRSSVGQFNARYVKAGAKNEGSLYNLDYIKFLVVVGRLEIATYEGHLHCGGKENMQMKILV